MRTYFSIPVFTLLVFLALAPNARADFDNGERFKDLVSTSTCSTVAECRRSGLELVSLFEAGTATEEISPSVATSLPRLQRIAEDQASIWGDTILEGNYEAEDATSLDQVQAIFRDGKLLSYRIVYSARARSGTRAGRISEASFVSASLRSWLRDDGSLAKFHTK